MRCPWRVTAVATVDEGNGAGGGLRVSQGGPRAVTLACAGVAVAAT